MTHKDNSACASANACQAVVCKGAAVNCDDDNACTVDTRDLAKGCPSS